MFVEIISKSGQSFAGCHAYCGHDEAANTSERVAWTETLNLGTKDPDVAWRVMSATAMDADRLKREAGVGPQGRKAERGPVLHMILSWDRDELPGMTREQQIVAAKEAIAKLGKDTTHSRKVKNGRRQYGDEHQAVIYAHNDKDHPHVHVMLNKVHPEHGRMLPDGNDQLKLQKWALDYQKRHGNEDLTPQRTLNHEARQRGEYVKYDPKLNRRDYEASQKVSGKAAEQTKELLGTQTARAWEINKEQRLQKKRHREAWQAAEQNAKDRVSRIETTAREKLQSIKTHRRRETAKGKRAVRDRFRPRWAELYHERQADLATFLKREKTTLGKVTNALRQIDFGKLLSSESPRGDAKVSSFREAFGLLASSGARLEGLKRKHQSAADSLAKEVRGLERAVERTERSAADDAASQAKHDRKTALRASRRTYQTERADLVRTNAMEQAKIKARWRSHDLRRASEWRALAAEHPKEAANFEARSNEATASAEKDAPTKPSDLLPRSEDAARSADSWKERLAEHAKRSAARRRNSNERDQGDDGIGR